MAEGLRTIYSDFRGTRRVIAGRRGIARGCKMAMEVDRLSDFTKAASLAQTEGTAFERADQLERGQAMSAGLLEEDETMQMPTFFSQANDISQNTRKIDQLTAELEKMHKQALNAATTEESGDLSLKIDVVTAKINQYANKTRNLLKEIQISNEQLSEIAPAGSGHMRMRESKHRQLATAFLKSTKSLQKLQQTYRDKYRQQLERQYKIVNPKATPEEIAKVTSDEAGAQQKIFASAVKEDSKKTLSKMKDRFQDVKLIEKSILELHQLFLDLQTLVVEQGDIINRVEYNVDKTVGYTDEAAQDLKQAVEYQKALWKKKWIFMVVCMVCIVILMLLVLYLIRPVFQIIANVTR